MVEAACQSGSLIIDRSADEFGRDLFTVPLYSKPAGGQLPLTHPQPPGADRTGRSNRRVHCTQTF